MQPWESDRPRYKRPSPRLRDTIQMKAGQLSLGLVIAAAIYAQMIFNTYRPNTKTNK